MTTRILLVEDELLVALSLREALCETGFDVECAYLARTVIDDTRCIQWDAALVDMCLPDESGASVIRHLRDRQPMLPVILTTGMETPETQRFASELGITMLAKPFEEKTLIDLLKRLLVDAKSAQRGAQTRLLRSRNGRSPLGHGNTPPTIPVAK